VRGDGLDDRRVAEERLLLGADHSADPGEVGTGVLAPATGDGHDDGGGDAQGHQRSQADAERSPHRAIVPRGYGKGEKEL